jgi:hypothetical protein
MIEVRTGGVSDRTESARGIAAEAKEPLQKLGRQSALASHRRHHILTKKRTAASRPCASGRKCLSGARW